MLCGVAGSGKTHRVLHEAAQAALANLAGGAGQPGIAAEPLYIIVPEQHTLLVERQLLDVLQSEHGRRAYTGLQVTSFTRLGRLLHGLASEPPRQISELGRQLIAWQLLDARERNAARANELAQMLGELVQYGVGTDEAGALARCAERLALSAAGVAQPERKLAGKLTQLAAQYREYSAWCGRLGLQVRDWALEITAEALRNAEASAQAAANPLLRFSRARLWFDGFMGLTPPELAAAQALLTVCQNTTLTLLLDPALARLEPAEQAVHPLADWYAPTLELAEAWRRACRDAGTGCEIECLAGTPPRFAQPVLARLAHYAGQASEAEPAGEARSMPDAQPAHAAAADGINANIRAYTCATQRAEIDLACRSILELVQERGWRYGEICVLARDVKPLQALLAARLADYGIPAHLDLREGLGRHPLVEYIKCALRLAAGTAQLSDAEVLLDTGLLPMEQSVPGQGAHELLKRVCWLIHQRQYRAVKLLHQDAWEAAAAQQAADGRAQDATLWQTAYAARLAAFAHVSQLSCDLPLHSHEALGLAELLRVIWRGLLGADTQARLAEADWPVLEQLAQLWDELALLGAGLNVGGAGGEDGQVAWAQFQQWLEYGLDQLSLRQPPLALDHVIVSSVEEGRVPPVKAVLILGLSEDSWQPRLGARRLFTDTERAQVNAAWQGLDGRGGGLLAPGDSTAAAREPYLALVAATRAAEFVQLSYAALDRERKPRQPSRYFRWLTQALGVAPVEYPSAAMDDARAAVACIYSEQDAALSAAAQASATVAEHVLGLLAEDTRGLITWRRANPADELIAQAAYWRGRLLRWREPAVGQPLLQTSATQLEAFAKCPFAFLSTHLLGLDEPEQADIGNRQLGLLYHSVLQQLLEPLAAEVRRALPSGGPPPPPDWAGLAARLPGLIDAALAELALEDTVRRGVFLKQRCQVLLTYMLAERARLAAAGEPRWPLALEAAFGAGQAVPAAVLPAGGFAVELRGKLDRIDLDHTRSLAVVDYKLGQRKLEAWRILQGLELQLPVYLLALSGASALLGDGAQRTWPLAQAEYQPIEPYFKGNRAALAPASVPTAAMVKALEKTEPPVDPAAGLLGRTVEAITQYAAQIKELHCAPQPVRSPDGKWRACLHCAFQPLCRFDALNGGRYRQAAQQKMDATAWREWLAQGAAWPGAAGEPNGGAPC
jgi:ATP-dependent helicase/nuclease subunit B